MLRSSSKSRRSVVGFAITVQVWTAGQITCKVGHIQRTHRRSTNPLNQNCQTHVVQYRSRSIRTGCNRREIALRRSIRVFTRQVNWGIHQVIDDRRTVERRNDLGTNVAVKLPCVEDAQRIVDLTIEFAAMITGLKGQEQVVKVRGIM